MKITLLTASFLTIGLFLARSVFADDITFPITQLGNCSDYQSCFNYCENPNNHAACLSYRVLGDSTTATSSATTLTFPISSLGNCSSYTSCKIFCDQLTNHNACYSFALTHHLLKTRPNPSLGSGNTATGSGKTLTDAEQFLGCKDMTSCRDYCDNSANRDRCRSFAEMEGLHATTIKPLVPTSLTLALFQAAQQELGCNSEDSCRTFCSQQANYQACLSFAQKHALGKPPAPTATPSGVTPYLRPPAPGGSYTYPRGDN